MIKYYNNNWVYWLFDSSNFYILSSPFFNVKLRKNEFHEERWKANEANKTDEIELPIEKVALSPLKERKGFHRI